MGRAEVIGVPEPLPLPRAGSVEVWTVRTMSEGTREDAWRSVLSSDERARADRYRFTSDRLAFTVTRAALRTFLGRYLDAAPDELRFTANGFGKPSLPNAAGLSFNVSHSGEWALLAFTMGSAVGVDLERVDHGRNVDALARAILTEEELTRFTALPPPARAPAFARAWTRKEAVVKAVGTGLATPLDRVTVTFTDDEPARILHLSIVAHDAADWSLHDLPAPPGYATAVAVRGRVGEVVVVR